MKFLVASVLCLLCVAALWTPVVRAQEAGEADGSYEEAEVVEEFDLSSPYAEIYTVFPNNQALQAGRPSEIFLGFKNNGKSPFRVSGLRGSLYYLNEARYAVENYTLVSQDLVVESGQQYSFAYRFASHPVLLGEFGFFAQIFYNDGENRNYTTTFWNSTVTIVEPEAEFEFQSIFQYSFIIAVFAAVAFVLYKKFAVSSKSSAGVSKKASGGAEWQKGTALEHFGKEKKAPKVDKANKDKKN